MNVNIIAFDAWILAIIKDPIVMNSTLASPNVVKVENLFYRLEVLKIGVDAIYILVISVIEFAVSENMNIPACPYYLLR